jgi:hypothetical protein
VAESRSGLCYYARMYFHLPIMFELMRWSTDLQRENLQRPSNFFFFGGGIFKRITNIIQFVVWALGSCSDWGIFSLFKNVRLLWLVRKCNSIISNPKPSCFDADTSLEYSFLRVHVTCHCDASHVTIEWKFNTKTGPCAYGGVPKNTYVFRLSLSWWRPLSNKDAISECGKTANEHSEAKRRVRYIEHLYISIEELLSSLHFKVLIFPSNCQAILLTRSVALFPSLVCLYLPLQLSSHSVDNKCCTVPFTSTTLSSPPVL